MNENVEDQGWIRLRNERNENVEVDHRCDTKEQRRGMRMRMLRRIIGVTLNRERNVEADRCDTKEQRKRNENVVTLRNRERGRIIGVTLRQKEE